MSDFERDGGGMEFVRDRVCPECSTRLRIDRTRTYVYCAGCGHYDDFIPASQLTVTGGGEGSSAIDDDAGNRESASAPPLTLKKTRR